VTEKRHKDFRDERERGIDRAGWKKDAEWQNAFLDQR